MARSKHQLRIEQLMLRAGQELPISPSVVNLNRHLRAKLIIEEALELIELGLGLQVQDSMGMPLRAEEILLVPKSEPDIIEIIDGCADVSVVTIGTASAVGVDMTPILEIVDNNNLMKFGPGGYRRDDGKWIKPENHPCPKPLIQQEIERQRYGS